MSMHFERLWQNVNFLWAIFVVYNTFSVRKLRVKRALPSARISVESIGIVLAAFLIFFPKFHLAFLAARFHNSFQLEIAGFCITVAGLTFSAWSRDVLGKNWSSRPVIQLEQELIVAGPYAYLRHPLYAGLLVAMAGTVLVWGEYGSLLGWALALGYFCGKARREEYLLQLEFGPRYSEYRAHTGFLVPRLAHI